MVETIETMRVMLERLDGWVHETGLERRGTLGFGGNWLRVLPRARESSGLVCDWLSPLRTPLHRGVI